jgi:uncharacterized protein (DUF2384 family)
MPETGTKRERTLDLQKHAEEIFGDAGIAKRWLQEQNLATEGKPPLALLGSENGYARVKTLLDRIDYGVLA